MVAVTLCTTPGTPRPGCGSTCPQARPVTPSLDDGVYHQNLLRLLLEEHVMALHQDRRTGTSSLPSRALLVAPRPHPTDASLHVTVSLALTKPALSAAPPCAHEVSHLHMHKTPNK